MTKTQVQLVRDSFAKIEPMAVEAGILFYKRLFSEYPELQLMFCGTLEQHGRTLMNVIALAVDNLDDLDFVTGAVEELGDHYTTYGVVEGHYGVVASVLLASLGEALGDAFTSDVKAAWSEMFLMLAGVMILAKQNSQPHPVAA
jgi:hemoglobin-like flavoprotein